MVWNDCSIVRDEVSSFANGRTKRADDGYMTKKRRWVL